MNPEAVRLYAVLLVWLALGLVASAWTIPLQDALGADAELPALFQQLPGDPGGGRTFQLQMFLLGCALAAAAVLLTRRVRGRTGPPLHAEVQADAAPAPEAGLDAAPRVAAEEKA